MGKVIYYEAIEGGGGIDWEKEFRYMQKLNYEGQQVLNETNKAIQSLKQELEAKDKEIERLNGLINNPELENFIKAVKIEAAHQLERWGIEKEEREPPHHYILVATKLLGKLSIAIWDKDIDKFKHHCITLAAEMHNCHRQIKKEGTVIHKYFHQTENNL